MSAYVISEISYLGHSYKIAQGSCSAFIYRKHRKFRGVINFAVFADATIPRNLILDQQFTQLYWYSNRL